MKLVKLTQWIDKTKTQPILVNKDLIQSVAMAKHDEPTPIIGENNTTWLTHVVFKGGTHGFLVTETFEQVSKLVQGSPALSATELTAMMDKAIKDGHFMPH